MRDGTQEARGTRTQTVDVGALVDLALHMANRADEVALAGFGSNLISEAKSDGSPVTRIDREIESMMRDTIEREHPRAGVLGEEYGEEHGIGRWVLDPIDGTRELIAGDPRFSVLIAYELEGESQLGVVSAPALGLRWWAGRGLGAFASYQGVVSMARVSATRKLSRSHGMLPSGFVDPGLPILGEGARHTRHGVSWEAVRVASGEYDFALTVGHLWDVAPISVIVEEAGGWANLLEEENGHYRLTVSNGHLAGLNQR